jgi:hypothetical protein
LKGALFQAFVKNPKGVAIPQQQLDAIPALIDKHVDTARERILFKVLAIMPDKPSKLLRMSVGWQ